MAVAILLSLYIYKLAVDAMCVEQLMELLKLLVPLDTELQCLVDDLYATLLAATATVTATAFLSLTPRPVPLLE